MAANPFRLIASRQLMRDRLLEAWSEREGGDERWYYTAHDYAAGLSRVYNELMPKCAAVLALFSPRLRWDKTQLYADMFLAGQHPPYLEGQIAKAHRIMGISDSEARFPAPFIEIFGNGYKTLNFFGNIMYPWSNAYVTIDTHMASLMLAGVGTRLPKSAKRIRLDNPIHYDYLVEQVVYVADYYNTVPSMLQAACWIVHRRKLDVQPKEES